MTTVWRPLELEGEVDSQIFLTEMCLQLLWVELVGEAA